MLVSVAMEKSLSGVTTLFQVLGLQFFSIHSYSLEDGFHNRGGVSKKHKLSFVFIVACLTLEFVGIYYAILLEKEQEQNKNVNTGLSFQYLVYFYSNFVVIVAVVNAYATTAKTRAIFCNFEKISNIFRNSLREIIDFKEFSKRFNTTMIKISTFFIIDICATLIFVYQHNQSNIFLWTVLAIFPYFFFTIMLSYLIFFIKFINLYLDCMVEALDKLNRLHELSKLGHGIHIELKSQRINCDELFNSMLALRRIYGCLSETTCMINEVLGIPLIVLITDLIMANSSGGYKLFLSVMGEVFIGRVGGENK